VASLVVLVITLLAAGGSVRYGWDLDNVVSPLVTATGDVVSLPALVLAAELAGVDVVTPAIAWTAASIAALVFVWTMRTHLPEVVRVVRQSVPVLVIAGTVDLVAGITVEKRLDDFLAFPVLLILLPGFLGTAGALGGVLSSRLATKMHLGLLRPAALPGARARGDIMMVFSLSVPVFAVLGLAAQVGGVVSDHPSPGSLDVITVAVLGGLLATIFVVLVAYYGTAVAVQFGLDPDTYGIPMVTSSLDFVGAFAFIFAAVAVGVA
ncbi:MAG: magnesium transporter, partial [Acidimicrobiales bacterium]